MSDPILTHDEATGFYVERREWTLGDQTYTTFWAYPDERWVYHLHRGNHSLGNTAQEAIDALAKRRVWAMAA